MWWNFRSFWSRTQANGEDGYALITPNHSGYGWYWPEKE